MTRRILVPARGVSFSPLDAGRLAITRFGTTLAFDTGDLAVACALCGSSEGRATESELVDSLLEGASDLTLARLYFALDELRRLGLLSFVLEVEGVSLARVEPFGGTFDWSFTPKALDEPVLSRFAYLRRQGDELILESPVATARVALIPDSAASVLGVLGALASTGTGMRDTSERGLTETQLSALLGTLAALGFLEEARGREADARKTWEFHDVLFHRRSRAFAGRPERVGATFRFAGEMNPPRGSSTLPHATRDPIALPAADLERLATDDLPFTRVLEARRSLREAGALPIAVAELGEFLHRTVRARDDAIPETGTRRRVYPGGGGIYEIEVYACVNHCQGLDKALYHYDAEAHALTPIDAEEALIDGMLETASSAWGGRPPPQVLLVLTARFPEMAFKYEGMAYRAVLLDTGVLFQTFYLVATAMGLAPCALGNGNPDLLARAARLDPFEQIAVGEFALSRAKI